MKKRAIFQGGGILSKTLIFLRKNHYPGIPGQRKTSPKHEKHENIQKNQKISDQTHANKIEKTIKHKRLASGNTRFPEDF